MDCGKNNVENAMDGVCKEGKFEDCKEVVYRLNPNVIAESTLIDGLCNEGMIDEAKQLLYEIRKKNTCSNVVRYKAKGHTV